MGIQALRQNPLVHSLLRFTVSFVFERGWFELVQHLCDAARCFACVMTCDKSGS